MALELQAEHMIC